MASSQPSTQGTKRCRNGQQKSDAQQSPTCAQPPRELHTSSLPTSLETSTQMPSNQTSHNANKSKNQKLPRLPDNITLTKRPIQHPPIPTPYSSDKSPKTLYIKASSPFIPSIKRIRSLLLEIEKRTKQSTNATLPSLRSNGRLNSLAVERAIADSSAEATNGAKERECVYVKATGQAIQRALEIGVYFQGEKDCAVRVEMGSVKAIDDIEVNAAEPGKGKGVVDDDGDVDMTLNNDNDNEKEGDRGKGKKRRRAIAEEDVPETRIRTLSSITVAISLV